VGPNPKERIVVDTNVLISRLLLPESTPGRAVRKAVAVNGRADLIITGDRDLLALDPFIGVAIISPAAYLSR